MHIDSLIRRSHRMGIRIAVAVWAAASLAPSGVQACACCTDIGQRYVGTDTLDSYKRAQIEALRFAPAAELFTGNAEPGDLKGIRATAISYALEVDQRDDGILFTFRDKDGRTGTLLLAWPELVSILEVDPRQDKRPGGLGPSLYKEWSVTARLVGTGILAPGNDAATRVTLIVQGSGNSCTSATDFTAWTLVVKGPNAAFSFFGELLSPR